MRNVPLKHFPVTLAVHDAPELVSDEIAATGEWERYETRLLTTLLRPGATFVDVGANVGYYSAIAALQVTAEGRVIAFEPDPDNFMLLAKNVSHFTNVAIYQAALGSHRGEMAFARCSENRGDHRLSNAATPATVNVVPGDDVIDAAVDVIKIDTQGAELIVIQGLQQTLARSRSHLSMIIEFWPQALGLLGATAGELLDQLDALELNYWIIDHEGEALVAASSDQLRALAETIMAPDTGGFMNILATSIEGPIDVT